jgi:hypothetical protein
MVVPLLAMPPPQMLLIWPIGFLFVLLIAWFLVTATRTRGNLGEQNRRAGLALLTILCGPLVGAALAWLFHTRGDVHPPDVGETYVVFTVIGGVAGLLGGVVFGITGLLSFRDAEGKAVPTKPVDVTDEL